MIMATLCYVRQFGRTLMLHRNKRPGDMHHGKWNGLGGKIEAGESPEDCVKREVFEEAGIRITAPLLRGILTFPEFNDGKSWYAFVFTADSFEGTVQGECDEGRLEWIEDSRLTELPLWEGDRHFIEWIRQNRFFSARFCYRQGRLADHDVVFYPSAGSG